MTQQLIPADNDIAYSPTELVLRKYKFEDAINSVKRLCVDRSIGSIRELEKHKAHHVTLAKLLQGQLMTLPELNFEIRRMMGVEINARRGKKPY
jgi:hypothetical protein